MFFSEPRELNYLVSGEQRETVGSLFFLTILAKQDRDGLFTLLKTGKTAIRSRMLLF